MWRHPGLSPTGSFAVLCPPRAASAQTSVPALIIVSVGNEGFQDSARALAGCRHPPRVSQVPGGSISSDHLSPKQCHTRPGCVQGTQLDKGVSLWGLWKEQGPPRVGHRKGPIEGKGLVHGPQGQFGSRAWDRVSWRCTLSGAGTGLPGSTFGGFSFSYPHPFLGASDAPGCRLGRPRCCSCPQGTPGPGGA